MVPLDELEDSKHSSRLPRVAVWIAITAVVVAIGFVALRPTASEIGPGSAAPEFDLPLLAGAGRIDSEGLRGKAVVLNFWASSCYSCKEEAPVLDRAWRDYKDEGVVVLGVNVARDSAVAAQRFADAFGMTFPLVKDEGGQLARALGINDAFLPQTFFIDREWKLASLFSGKVLSDAGGSTVLGPVTAKSLRNQIESMLRET
ncbi:MAG: TlpA family protein disulfide reductase [Actinomycetota bacterium]